MASEREFKIFSETILVEAQRQQIRLSELKERVSNLQWSKT
jgi:hypothetical protein